MTRVNKHDTTAVLRQCYLFTEADDASLQPLAKACVIEKKRRKSCIFTVDDAADGLRIILSGEVRIWIAEGDGRELTLSFLGAGDAFGEIALLDGLLRTANATASRDVECLFLPINAVERALETDPALARHLIYSLCELNRRNLGTISSFAFSALDMRLCKLLCELAFENAIITDNVAVFSRKFSQTDLALLLGVTREAVNKRFKSLEHEGLVKVDENVLVLPDLAALAARADTEKT